MKMSEEMAVRLHRMMWSDMQRELGDNPSSLYRIRFKEDWINRMFPGESINNHCWLCEYASSVANPSDTDAYCKYCPIRWPYHHCNTWDFSYEKVPISEILALPARNEKLTGLEAEYIANDKETASKWYYQYREELLSKASGIPASAAIEDHVKKIQEKASNEQESNGALEKLLSDTVNTLKLYQSALSYESKLPSNAPITDHIKVIVKNARDEGFDTAKEYLAECSGVDQNKLIFDHIRAIKEKAVEEYFEKQPAAKMVSMDVDNAFKQYADEQKAPIFRALAEESRLDPTATVKAHMNAIYSKGVDDGKDEERERIMDKIGEMLKK